MKYYIPPVDPRGQLHSGQVFCVNSRNGASGNHGKDWANALATIDQGINKCSANTNDTVLVAPDHAETIEAADGFDADVAGVSIIGLQQGGLMPTLTFETSVDADVKLAANNVTLAGIRFLGNIDATTGVLNITGNDVSVFDCEYRDVTGQATDVIVTDNALRLRS